MSFSDWLTECDKVCNTVCGMDVIDLPDCIDQWTLWNNGWSPEQAIDLLMKEAGYF